MVARILPILAKLGRMQWIRAASDSSSTVFGRKTKRAGRKIATRNARCPTKSPRAISDLMPARGLIYHEWTTHGTCSGLDPAGFFGLVRRAYNEIVIPSGI